MADVALTNRTYNDTIKRADQYCKSKEYEEALSLYKKSYELKPDLDYSPKQIAKLNRILELRNKISEKSASYSYNKAMQMALKTVLNATYGAFANKYFVLSNSKIANAITAMGRDLIRYMVVSSEDYFYNKWHLDTDAHKLLGTEYIAKGKDGKYYFLNKEYTKTDRPYSHFNTGELGDILISRKINLNKLKKIEGQVGDFELLYEYKIFDIDTVKPLDAKPKWKVDLETGVKFYDGYNTITKYCDTDSCIGNTIIPTNNGNMTIEELYNKNMYSPAGNTLLGHESVKCEEKVLNWDVSLYYAPVKRIIRHKVTKAKWRLKTKSGKEIIVTNDHSMIVFRDGEKIEVKPYDILKTDKILTIIENYMNTEIKYDFEFDDIESCEQIGEFEDDYVYDIEVDDYTHTFIANNILVHNSMYISYKPIMESIDYDGDELEFILHFDKVFMKKLHKDYINVYADKFGVANKQDFELETISKSILFFEKKNYLKNIVWEDGIFFEPLSYFSPTGIKIVRSETPPFVRGKDQKGGIWEFIKYLFENPDNLNIKDILRIIKQIRREFDLEDVDNISSQTSCSNYQDKVINDNSDIEVVSKTHYGVKAAAFYNYLLNRNSELKTKYDVIRGGGKIKYYYCKHDKHNVFGYMRGMHPNEITEKEGVMFDYDAQFDKTVLSICNGFLKALDLPMVNKRMSILGSLFAFKLKQPKPEDVEDEDDGPKVGLLFDADDYVDEDDLFD